MHPPPSPRPLVSARPPARPVVFQPFTWKPRPAESASLPAQALPRDAGLAGPGRAALAARTPAGLGPGKSPWERVGSASSCPARLARPCPDGGRPGDARPGAWRAPLA